jgi:hypothetical protein
MQIEQTGRRYMYSAVSIHPVCTGCLIPDIDGDNDSQPGDETQTCRQRKKENRIRPCLNAGKAKESKSTRLDMWENRRNKKNCGLLDLAKMETDESNRTLISRSGTFGRRSLARGDARRGCRAPNGSERSKTGPDEAVIRYPGPLSEQIQFRVPGDRPGSQQ